MAKSKKSPYAKGSKIVKSRTKKTKYGQKVEDVKKGSKFDLSDDKFTERPVNSSNIETIAYKRNTNTLQIRFKDNSVYHYFDVPETEHRQMINSTSKGKYLHQHIKGKYKYRRVS